MYHTIYCGCTVHQEGVVLI